MGTVDTIIGLDNISDYSDNFTEDKDSFYEVLSYVQEGTDIMTVFDTKDDRIALFTSGKTEGGDKGFVLFVADTAVDILRFFESKYTEVYLDFSLSEQDREKQAKDILLLSQSLVQLTDLKEEDLDEDIN